MFEYIFIIAYIIFSYIAYNYVGLSQPLKYVIQ